MKKRLRFWGIIVGVVTTALAVLAFILRPDGDHVVVNNDDEINALKDKLKDELSTSSMKINTLKEELHSDIETTEDIKVAIKFLKDFAND